MQLRIRALGLAVGIVFGLCVFLATVSAIWFGQGLTLSRLAIICPGYTVSYPGAFLGLVWGIVVGFVDGAIVALLYNRLLKVLYRAETT